VKDEFLDGYGAIKYLYLEVDNWIDFWDGKTDCDHQAGVLASAHEPPDGWEYSGSWTAVADETGAGILLFYRRKLDGN